MTNMLTEPSFRALSFPSLGRTDTERIETEARTRGHAAGYAAGLRVAEKAMLEQELARDAEHAEQLRAGQAAVEQAIELLTTAVRSADARLLPILQESQDTLAAAAIDLAEAVIGHELSDGPGSARAALLRALDAVAPAEPSSVRLNPGDLALIDPEVRARSGVALVADASLQPGDAIADMPNGYLDARIGTALSRAKATLLGSES
ncbi:MAG TPA: FliH/SctL family protein [Mycetocola sp.]|jgi:flagellar assembly protein FliH|nr:FliH/SctL family protein [Mycetocola sp.]